MKSNKKKNKCSIRPFGQRSISSTFLFRPSNLKNVEAEEEAEAPIQKKSSGGGSGSGLPSLSDFLNKKLHRSSVLPSSAPPLVNQGKDIPFSPPVSNAQRKTGSGETDAKFSIDTAFHIFKNVKKEKGNSENCSQGNETGELYDDELCLTRKRKNPLEANENEKLSRRKLVVLGEDTKRKHGKRRVKAINNEPGPLYNHYKNGGGWWDDNMEGVDNEEVGCSEAWEGVGCTTLGGIEWH